MDHVYDQNWKQYQRYVAADDAGWIYFGIGSTASQIIAFNPKTREAIPVIPEEERVKGSGSVYRDMNGKVYGHSGSGNDDDWYELYKGTITPDYKAGRSEPQTHHHGQSESRSHGISRWQGAQILRPRKPGPRCGKPGNPGDEEALLRLHQRRRAHHGRRRRARRHYLRRYGLPHAVLQLQPEDGRVGQPRQPTDSATPLRARATASSSAVMAAAFSSNGTQRANGWTTNKGPSGL